MKLVFTVFNLFLFLGRVFCYPSGAPDSVCDSMTPGHGVASQPAGTSPFQVYVEKPFYKAGEPVTVTIESSGSDLIKGMLVQAREVGKNAAIGTFSASGLPSGVQYLKCNNPKDAVTHSMRLALSNISLKWSPPSDVSGMANISFFATVVKNHSIFWVKLASQELYKKDVQPDVNATTTMQMMASSSPIMIDVNATTTMQMMASSSPIMLSSTPTTNSTCETGSKCNAYGFLPDLLLLFFSLVILLAEHVF